MHAPRTTAGGSADVVSHRVLRSLILVYDAPAGRIAALRDSLMKLAGGGCALCFLTHGLLGKRDAMRMLEQELGTVTVRYLHRGETATLEQRLGRSLTLPTVLAELADGALVVLMDPAAIEGLRARQTAATSMPVVNRGEDLSLRGALAESLRAQGISSPLGAR